MRENLKQEGMIDTRLIVLHLQISRTGVLVQEIQSQSPQQTEIARRVSCPNPESFLGKHDIKTPMPRLLHSPMGANVAGTGLSINVKRTQEKVSFAVGHGIVRVGSLSFSYSFRLFANLREQFQTREVLSTSHLMRLPMKNSTDE
jgi:hypothetical protein